MTRYRSSKETGEKREKQTARTKHMVALTHQIFTSPDGKEFLDWLTKVYDHDELHAPDSNTTSFNLGAQSVVRQIKQLVKQGESNG